MKILSVLRVVSVVLLAAMVTGCFGGSVDSAHQASAKRIGVISVLNASMDPGLVDAACAYAADRLRAAHPTSAVVELQAERGNVYVRTTGRPGLFNTGEFQARNQDVADAARRLAGRHALNLVVLIVPSVGVNSGAGQPPNNPGCGVWSASLFGARIGDPIVYANFSVEAFDGATGQRLAFKTASRHFMTGGSSTLREIVCEGVGEQLAHMHLTLNE